MEPVSTIVGAALGGAGADVYQAAKQKAQEQTGTNLPEHGPIEMHLMVELLSEALIVLKDIRGATCPDRGKVVAFCQPAYGNEYILTRNGYSHVSVLCAQALQISVATAVGTVTFNLNAGWNPLELPDSSRVTLAANGTNPQTASVYIRWGSSAIDMEGV